MIVVRQPIKFIKQARGRKRIVPADQDSGPVESGQIPRVSRLMALAIRLERMLRSGEVADVAELSMISDVTQPRISQILGLTLLAPDIQEELLFLPRVLEGKATIHEKMLRPIVKVIDWDRQRAMWRKTISGHVKP